MYVVLSHGDQQWLMHEYRVEKGLVSKLLWKDAEVAADIRTHSVGEAKLIFPANTTLYVTYSEVQWTAAKCSQVIGSARDREAFMQRVSLSSINASSGGKDLLTEQQARNVIAEVAEAEGDNKTNDDVTPYVWEHTPLYRHVGFEQIRQQASTHPDDHLYLVLEDDIGVLRDLAAYQDKVVEWIGDWQSDDTRHQKYVEGCYIESQLDLAPDRIDKLALALGDQSFVKDLDARQKQALEDWIEAWDKYSDDMSRPVVGEKFREMERLLGPELMSKHEGTLFAIKDRFLEQAEGVSWWKALWSGNAGTDGIEDLIDREAMEAFLAEERKKLQHWHRLLDSISDDRTALFSRFYTAAWYFDPSSSEQIQAALAAEYGCIKDICRSDKATQQVADTLNRMPWVLYSMLYTLPKAQLDKTTKDIGERLKGVGDLIERDESRQALADISAQLNSLVRTLQPTFDIIAFDAQLSAFSELNDSAYAPANTVGMAEKAQKLLGELSTERQFDPSNVLRNLKDAEWLSILKAYDSSGITIELATEAEVKIFKDRVDEAGAIRNTNRRLKNRLRELKIRLRREGGIDVRIAQMESEFRANQQRLSELEPKIAAGMSPFGTEAGRIGYRIQGLTPHQHQELEKISTGERVNPNQRLLQPGVLDGLAVIIAVCQIWIAVRTFNEFGNDSLTARTSKLDVVRDITNALGASFAAGYGLWAGRNMNAIKEFTSATQKLVYGVQLGRMATYLGGSAYFFSLASSGIKVWQAYAAYQDALRRGDRQALIKAGMAIGTEGTLTAMNGYGLGRSLVTVMRVTLASPGSKAAIWATEGMRLLSLGARLNLIGIAVSAVQLGTTVWINHNHLTPYMQWFKQSRWGQEPMARTLPQSNLALARITARPRVDIEALTKGHVLTFELPAIPFEELDRAEVKIALYWLIDAQRNDWQPWTQKLQQQWLLLSGPGEGLKMGLALYPEEVNAGHGIGIELHYKPVPEASADDVLRFQTDSLNRIGQLQEVALLKVRDPSSTNLLPLTTQTITQVI
ncbi:hypothetical protein ADIMK_1108 [Marinobacterium lacunae]|uniref:Toxin VasX N-terminal region domain-containing protein n=1 Tax=Marinobacterium lacunae TaxID=1232683 RepID=A0A081G1K0_9GAMM|nr:hypothetical protein ADIMK_1108 [Marinobacterium lacunae]